MKPNRGHISLLIHTVRPPSDCPRLRYMLNAWLHVYKSFLFLLVNLVTVSLHCWNYIARRHQIHTSCITKDKGVWLRMTGRNKRFWFRFKKWRKSYFDFLWRTILMCGILPLIWYSVWRICRHDGRVRNINLCLYSGSLYLLKPVSSVETSYEWMNVHQILFDF